MKIEAYFRLMIETVENCASVSLSDVNCDKRGTHEGFIRGELLFPDGSILRFREYVDVERRCERLMYAYQFTTSEDKLIFRYDNTCHHKKKNLSTFPHHKHNGSEQNVIASVGPVLVDVLEEIELFIDP